MLKSRAQQNFKMIDHAQQFLRTGGDMIGRARNQFFACSVSP